MKYEKISEETFTITEMCKTFKVTARTLRFYEAKELLFPIRKDRKRFFTRRDNARLKLILEGKRFGFALEEIRQLLNLYDIGDQQATQLSKTYELANERLAVMIKQRDDLDNAIGDLKKVLQTVKKMLKEKL